MAFQYCETETQLVLKYFYDTSICFVHHEAQWYNPLTLQSERSGRQGLITGRAPLLDHHNKGLWDLISSLQLLQS